MSNRYGPGLAICLSLGLLVASAGSTSAGEGVVHISPDGPWPKQITQSGSYVLTGDLIVPSPQFFPNRDAIEIGAGVSDVTIDLNGFSIIGQGTGTGRGIDGATADDVRILNGRIEAAGEDCVRLGARAVIEGVSARNCGDEGIQCGASCRVSGSLVQGNGQHGILVGERSQVTENISLDNDENGIDTDVTGGALIRHNITRDNGLAFRFGIAADNSATIVENVVYSNGVVAPFSGGISATTAALILGNLIYGNPNTAIADVLAGTGFGENVTDGPAAGFGFPNLKNLGGNSCGAVVCPP